MKILSFDASGYWIWSKRLEQGQFGQRGAASEGKRVLNRTALLALLEGVDIEIVCGFRSNPITESGASRSLIPIQPDH